MVQDAPGPGWNAGRYWLIGLGVPATLAVIGFAIALISGDRSDDTWAENGWIEWWQVALWGVCILAAGWVAFDVRGKARAAVAWRGVLAMVTLAREFDLHEKLNPETLGAWGVRYRIDWWLDMSEPLGAKALWLAVGLVVGVALAVPMWRARQDPVRLLRARHPASVWFGAAVGFLAMGWLLDDVLRGMLPREPAQAAEEICELLGVGCYLASVVACRAIPARGIVREGADA